MRGGAVLVAWGVERKMERGESQYLHSSPNLLASLVPINGGTPLITMMFDHEDSASVIMCKCASVIMCKCDHVQMCKCASVVMRTVQV